MLYFVNPYYYLIGALLAIAIVCFVYAFLAFRRQALAKKFVKVGNMNGKSFQEVESVVGAPTSIERTVATNTGEPIKIVTWSRWKFCVVIMFDKNDMFDHIVSESAD